MARTHLASSQALYELLDDLVEQLHTNLASRPDSGASFASTVLELEDDPAVIGGPPQSTGVTINSRVRVMNKPKRPRTIKSAPASILKKRVSCDNVLLNTIKFCPALHSACPFYHYGMTDYSMVK